MSAVVDVALPVFAIMLAGYLAGRFRILGDTSSEALNAFVYWFALPPVLEDADKKVPSSSARAAARRSGSLMAAPLLLRRVLVTQPDHSPHTARINR